MKTVNIGILGFGNIGSAVNNLIAKNGNIIHQKTGLRLKVLKIADPKTQKSHPLLTRRPNEVLNDPSIDVIVETIGGTRPALDYILFALKSGKHVVTANKEVIAVHGSRIFQTARENNVSVFMEASVGGGIPILQPLGESLSANNITEVYGIVNGTTNFILSNMTAFGTDFKSVLAEAQAAGYAEKDPKNDIEGYDAAYKAVILAMVAFSVQVDFKDVYFEGISKINQEDISYANDIGYAIKLLAVAKMEDHELEVRVHPTLVPKDHALAAVSGPMNAICVKGDAVGELMFYGQGAGGKPTASAVVNDIVLTQQRSVSNKILPKARVKSIEKIKSRYYVHMLVPDRSGVLARIADAFAEEKVSIQSVLQKESTGKYTPLIIILHEVVEGSFNAALAKIRKLPVVHRIRNVIRVGL